MDFLAEPFKSSGTYYVIQCIVQDIELRPLNSFLPERWNPLNELPMHQGLQATISEQEIARLKMLGNIAIPQCAVLASEVMLHMSRGLFKQV